MTLRISTRRAALAAGCCLSALSLSAPAFAQEADEGEDAATLETGTLEAGGEGTVTITGPITGGELGRSTIARRQASTSDTAAVLTRIPGVSVATGGGFSSMPAIRGLSEQRLTVLVDGQAIDMSCPNDMNSPLSYTDPQNVASIRVLTGVAPVSKGGDNIGGVITVDSAPPQFSISDSMLLTGEASAFYRSNGDGFGGAVKLTAASRHVSATYTGSYTQSDQYDGGGDDGMVRSTEYAKTDHALALAVQSGTSLFQLKGGYHFSPYEGFVNQWMDMTSNKSWFLNGSYRGVFDWGKLDLAAAYRDTDHVMNFLEDKLPGSMPMNTEVHSFDASAKVELPLSMHDTVRLGSEYHHQWLDDYWPPVAGSMMMGPDEFVNINAATRDRIGAYAEWERHWSNSIRTTAGIRYDRVEMNTGDVAPYGTGMMQMADVMAANAFNAADHKRTDNNWSGSFLLTWQASDMAALELGYAHKARSPNIYERYTWGVGSMASRMIGWYGDGNGYVGNLDLKPERADTVSAALQLGGGSQAWSLRVAPYYTHVSDYVDAEFVKVLTDMMSMPTPFVQLKFANQEAEFYGVDVSGGVDLWRGEGQDGTRLNATASWLQGDNLTDGGPLYRQMPFNARLSLDHRQGALELGAELEWVAEKTRVDATRNEVETGAYALVNLSAAYTVGGVRVSLEAQNLLDKAYALPLGGMSLGDYGVTGDLRPVPGRGRSINVGLSTRF
ncbi:TonB-dependent receptor [Erythrobacter sp. SG61-1L]|uniref:TonB-dependent receptor n=1 Tax=Erythrobacter sp. SG61-1L TaxID=1603897 RepID=UPI0006C8E8CF|nr:TonB-dependent receptor [Erythrobacter sp. SG61-1L]KPL68771.1 TonB-dependent receptor [Erythrobacter sp. SG61-1L]